MKTSDHHMESIEQLGRKYERDVLRDVEENPLFDVGMRVEILSRGELVQGRIIKHLGFSEFWLSHKYDIQLDNGRVIDGAFEMDLRRIVGGKLSLAWSYS